MFGKKSELTLPPSSAYRPGGWAKASTLFAAAGLFANLWLENRAGSDITQGAIAMVLVALLLGVLPNAAASNAWSTRNGSQRAADAAFAIVMFAQGVALVVAGLMVPNRRSG